MKIFSNKNKLLKFIKSEKKLGFVPTMGAIHAGHISLINRSNLECNKTIVTIFINKPQFNKKNDFQKYPRTIKKDIRKLKKAKVNYLYIPVEKEIYPIGTNKKIKIDKFCKKLCGKFRPGHFFAVTDVVDRFIKIIRPHKIYLGEKDMQQYIILQDFVKRNFNGIKVVCCKTIRQSNGLALSSRNFLLNHNQKMIASKIYNFLLKKKNIIIKNKSSLKKIYKKIINFGVSKIDYIEVHDINKIIKPFKKNKKLKIFIAYYLGSIRLIDNL